MITDDLRNARAAFEAMALDFDPAVCSGDDAIACVKDLGIIRRLADGMVAKAAKRVEDTAAYTYGSDRSAAELTERLVGVSSGEAKRGIENAGKLAALPLTDAAVRAGRLSTRQTDLIVDTATDDPSVERSLIKAASKGMVEGHFKVTPEVGGAIKTVIEEGTRRAFARRGGPGCGSRKTRTRRTRSRPR